MTESVKEAQKRIDLESKCMNICYRRWSRIKFVKLSESQRKEFMANCVRFEYDKALEREKQEILRLSRRNPVVEMNRQRLEDIKTFKMMDEALSWERD